MYIKGITFYVEKNRKDNLCVAGFFILWQNQLVSIFGDATYSISLGIWVLGVTISTALRGMIMAVQTVISYTYILCS